LQSHQWVLKKCYGQLKQRHRTLRQRNNALLCWHRLSGLMYKGWAPRTKRSCKQVTEAIKFKKKRFNPYIVICNTLGYFTCKKNDIFYQSICHPLRLLKISQVAILGDLHYLKDSYFFLWIHGLPNYVP
jgi:hypothetical protein